MELGSVSRDILRSLYIWSECYLWALLWRYLVSFAKITFPGGGWVLFGDESLQSWQAGSIQYGFRLGNAVNILRWISCNYWLINWFESFWYIPWISFVEYLANIRCWISCRSRNGLLIECGRVQESGEWETTVVGNRHHSSIVVGIIVLLL